jgi:large-conductance mechanosensitive channel
MAWLGAAGIAAVIGIAVGALVDPLVKYILSPLFSRFKKKRGTSH